MIKFASPKIEKNTLNLFKRIINSGIFVHGKYTNQFEKDLNNFFKLKKHKILTTSSCTAALHLYFLSIGLKKNDEVLMSAQTHVATAHAVEICGAKPIFVDCELKTGNIDIDKIKSKINKKTICICITHFLGKPANMFKIRSIANQHKLKLVEDTALSIGSKIKGKFAGTFGDAGAFSFHPVKIITTAEGGALIVNNTKSFKKIKSLRSFGYDEASPDKRKIPGSYNINFCGLNYRMNEIEAAIGINELKRIKNKILTRKKNYHFLQKKIKNCKNFKILNTKTENGFQSSYYALTIILKKESKINRNKLIVELKNKGIQTSIYYPHPVPLLNYYRKKYNYEKKDFPNSSIIAYHSISFPVAEHVSKKDLTFIASRITKLIG